MIGRTAYVYDPHFLLHDTGMDAIRLPSGHMLDPEPHPSSLRIIRRTAQLVANSGLLNELVELPATSATEKDLLRFHTPEYIDRVRAMTDAGGGRLGRGTPVARGSWDAAILAAGTTIALTDAVLDGVVRAGFGLVRPPGHHATADEAAGYCVFNNVVLGVRRAQERGTERILVIDWDVHHGSGSQEAFWDDPGVLFVSLHQDNWFPGGSGAIGEVGGQGTSGTTVNIPLPPGTGDLGYARAFEELVLPIAAQFRPEVVFVSAGQDASMMDPLGRMLVTTAGFRRLASMTCEIAMEHAEGRLVAVQEGGYSASYAPFCTLAVLEGMVGTRTEVQDPLTGEAELEQAWVELRDEHVRAIAAARAVQSQYWDL